MKNTILHHLENDYTNPVRDPLWKHIYLSPDLERAIKTPPFVRLTRLKQLGLASQVYPGATHTRANHSLGVFHLAKRMVHTLIRSPHYTGNLTLEGVKAFLSAALFHDLGHFPYAHVLEDGLEVKDHEELTGEYIRQPPLAEILEKQVGTPADFTAAIVDHHLTYPQAAGEVTFFRHLLSGVLDPDKMDYLNRDAYFCGIPYGIQDTDFIISQMIPHADHGLCLSTKGILSVEHLLFSKYLMYKSVYWHKGVRSPSAIIKKALYLGLKDQVLVPSELYSLDDVTFAPRMAGFDHPALRAIQEAEIPGQYQTLYEQPYDEHSLFSVRLKTTADRLKTEDDIRLAIQDETGIAVDRHEIAIDVPHSVSFEVDLPIFKDGKMKSFMDSGTVFDRNVVAGFTSNLKKTRLVGPARLKGKLRNPEKYLHW